MCELMCDSLCEFCENFIEEYEYGYDDEGDYSFVIGKKCFYDLPLFICDCSLEQKCYFEYHKDNKDIPSKYSGCCPNFCWDRIRRNF